METPQKDKKDPSVLSDDIYNVKIFSKTNSFVMVIVFFLGFFNNFSLLTLVENKISTLLTANECGVEYTLDYSILEAELIFEDVVVSQCRGKVIDKSVERISLGFRGVAISPLGLKFNVEANPSGELLDGELIFSSQKMMGRVVDFNFSANLLKEYLPLQLAGDFRGSLNIEASYKKNSSPKVDMVLQSDSVEVLAQMVKDLKLPALSLSDLFIKASLVNDLFRIYELKGGGDIAYDLRGNINLDRSNLDNSFFEITGTFKPDSQLYESMPILNLLLSSKKKDSQGNFSIQLKGTKDKLQQPIVL